MSYYELLGVENTATFDKIKSAYRKLSMQHHPDRGGNEKEFVELKLAYEVLIDPEKRKYYDQYGKSPDQITTIRDKAILELENLIAAVIDELIDDSKSYPASANPLKIINRLLSKRREEYSSLIRSAIKTNRKLSKMKKKFRFKSDDNRIPEVVIDTKRRLNIVQYKQLKLAMILLNNMEELLLDCSYITKE